MFTTQQPVDWHLAHATADYLFHDPAYGMQKKVDGEKRIIVCENGNLKAFYRSGKPAPLTAKTRAWMPVDGTFMIEGEQGNRQNGDTGFFAFDVLSIDGDSVAMLPYSERLELLAGLHVPLLPTYRTLGDKQRVFNAIKAQGGEGVVFKLMEAAYFFGNTTTQVKMRNWRTDTFRVRASDGRGIELEFATGEPAGRCPGYAEPGELVDVRYQEITEKGKLRVPIFVCVRRDLE